MERQGDTAGVSRDLMSLTDDSPERRSAVPHQDDHATLQPGIKHLGIAPPSRSPSSSPSVSSSDTGENDEDGDEDGGYGYAEDGDSGGKLGHDDKLWLRLATGEERRQLLGTEEESSDRHSSCGEDDAADDDATNIWAINAEQQNYYEEQFRKLNKDVGGWLSGLEARKFFEKSGLPISDLSAIWQLSDVTQDGRLDKAEFFTAMHLVVLRRHGIDVPEELPPSLHPSRILSQLSGNSEDPRIKHPKAVRLTPDVSNFASGSSDVKPSATAGIPSVGSVTDGLLQSVPAQSSLPHHHRIRVDASDIKGIQRPTPRKTRPGVRPIGASAVPSLPPPGGEDSGGPASLPPTLAGAPPSAPPPPLVHSQKSSVFSSAANQMPPPPPPRVPVRAHHTRSSSLDLNKLDRESPTPTSATNGRVVGNSNQPQQQPPAVPPRSSPAPAVKPRGHTLAGPTDGRALSALMASSLVINDSRPSAFREYKRPGSADDDGADNGGAAWTRSLRVLNWEEERKEMKDRVAALLARIPLQNSEATREEVSAAVKWLQERRQTINAEIAELQSELSFLVASRQVMEQAAAANCAPLDG